MQARREQYRDRRGRTAVMISMPALLGLLAFVVVPFLLAVVLGFSNLRLGSPLPLEWVGLEQYRRIFADPSFTRAVFNNLLFALVIVPLQTVLALVLALLLNRRLHGIALFRTLFFMPEVFPLSLVAVVWISIFAPGPNGMMNAFPARHPTRPACHYADVAMAGRRLPDGHRARRTAGDSRRAL